MMADLGARNSSAPSRWLVLAGRFLNFGFSSVQEFRFEEEQLARVFAKPLALSCQVFALNRQGLLTLNLPSHQSEGIATARLLQIQVRG